jgi:hypothetical protein
MPHSKGTNEDLPVPDTSSDLGPFKGGRPFKFTDPAELRRQIQNYFDSCDPHIETRVVDGGVNQRGETIWYKREIMTRKSRIRPVDLLVHLA